MNIETVVSIPNRHGDILNTTVTLPDASIRRAPLMIILHGHRGFRNYGFLPWIAQGASQCGMIALRMCFSLNGMNNTSWRVEKPDDFARNTLTREVDDVHDLMSALITHELFEPIRDRWDGRLFIVGHSRGGGIALVAAAELVSSDYHPFEDLRVTGLNSVGTWTRWTPRQAQEWKSAGFVDTVNQRTGQTLRINATFVDDIEQNAARLSLENSVRILGHRLLFIHAAQDLTVPLGEVRRLVTAANSGAHLQVIENTTHTFGMTHPVERITPGFLETFNALMEWTAS